MGIKGLNKLINQYAFSAITNVPIYDIKGSKIAIDSEILVHKYRSNESKNSHIFGFINNIFWHLENGITPIYVFDGCPSTAKQENALFKRTNYKEQINRKAEELENKVVEQLDNIDSDILGPEINETLDQLFKVQRKITYMNVNKNHRNECKYLLKLLGIPFIVANEDAEAFCVTLQQKGYADYIYTEDTDIIPYSVANMYNNGNRPIKILRKNFYDNTYVTVIDVNEILYRMNLDPLSFIDMCILSGCDFCTNISKMGPLKAYNYISMYKSIEEIKKHIDIPEDFKYQDARDIFMKNYDQEIDKSLEIGSINTDDLEKYLWEERNMNPFTIIDKYYTSIKKFKNIQNS